MISVLFQIKNRSLFRYGNQNFYPFPNCIDSLTAHLPKTQEIEFIIADWGSTDWPIREWIGYHITEHPIHIINIESGQYSRGKGRNIAAQYAQGDIFFFLDVDMLVLDKLIDNCIALLKKGSVVFPIVEYATDPYNQEKKEFAGFGNLFIYREDYEQTNKWPEYYGYGWEDVEFYQHLKSKFNVQFVNHLGFIHQWHPQDLNWKDQYAEKIKLGPMKELQQIREKYKKQAEIEDENLKKQLLSQFSQSFYTRKKEKYGSY